MHPASNRSKVALAFIAMMLAFASSSRSEPNDLNQVDSVLDRLEKRLLDQESSGLSFGDKEALDSASKDGGVEAPTGKFKGKRVSVEGSTDRKSTRLNSSHIPLSRMPSSA